MNFKNVFVGVNLVTVLLFPMVVGAQNSDQGERFSDVPMTHQNIDAIEWLRKQGVVQGYDDGNFHPDDVVNRVEFLKMVYLVQGLGDQVLVTDISQVFPDIDVKAWYAPYVVFAQKQGTVEGYPDGNFRPGDEVKRAEALKIIFKEFYPEGVPPTVADLPYLEALDVNTWYYPYLVHGFTRCLIDREHETANEDGFLTYGLDKGMTRKEVAELLYRTKALKDGERIDLCDDKFDPPADVNVSVNRKNFAVSTLFFADYQYSSGYRYWGNTKLHAVNLNEVTHQPTEELLFLVNQDDEFAKTRFLPSPNGKKLMSLLPVKSNETDPSQVVISDVDGKFKLNLFEDGRIYGAAWSDDSEYVVWISWDESGQKLYWYHLGAPIDEFDSINLDVSYYYRVLGWKGNRLYVNRAHEGTEDPGEVGYFSFGGEYWANVSGFTKLFRVGLKSDFNESFSDDFTKVVYSEHSNETLEPAEGPYRLVYRDLSDPGNEIELAKLDRPFHAPVWTVDGKYLIYENAGTVWKMEMATRESEPLVNVELIDQINDVTHDLRPFDVSADGKYLVLRADITDADFENRSSYFLVKTNQETTEVEDVIVLAVKLYLNPDNVWWID